MSLLTKTGTLFVLAYISLTSGLSFAVAGGDRPFNIFDVSILLNAIESHGQGEDPARLDFDFTKINNLPLFYQKANSLQSINVSGIVSSFTENRFLKVFEKMAQPDPLSFPYNAILVGLRIDPCAPSENQNLLCLKQLRLIGEDADLEDRSVHLVYNLDDQTFKKLSLEIKNLNNMCNEVANLPTLSVHPCTSNSEFVGSLNKIILKYAKDQSLSKVTFQIRTSDSTRGTFWLFGAVVKDQKGNWAPLKTPSAPSTGEEVFAFGKKGAVLDQMTLTDFDKRVSQGLNHRLSQDETKNLITELENPSLHTPNNTSCMSCHASEALRSDFSELVQDNPLYFQNNPRENKESYNSGSADIRHFGYRFGMAKISRRTMVETANIVKYLNSK